jgi:hypothetical protein
MTRARSTPYSKLRNPKVVRALKNIISARILIALSANKVISGKHYPKPFYIGAAGARNV